MFNLLSLGGRSFEALQSPQGQAPRHVSTLQKYHYVVQETVTWEHCVCVCVGGGGGGGGVGGGELVGKGGQVRKGEYF